MTQKRLTERPRGRRGKYNFGASANRHMVGQEIVQTEWRRDVHAFLLSMPSPTSNERQNSTVIGPPGSGFTRQIRRVALHGTIALQKLSNNTTPDNIGGVFEIQMGLAEDASAFSTLQTQSEAPGLWRRYVTFTLAAGAFRFWLPSGWDQTGQGLATPAGSPMSVYVGMTLRAITATTNGPLQVAGLLSTQEKELRIYA